VDTRRTQKPQAEPAPFGTKRVVDGKSRHLSLLLLLLFSCQTRVLVQAPASPVSLDEFSRLHRRIYRIVKSTQEETTVDWSLRQYPCLHGYKERHPTRRVIRGVLILEFQIWKHEASIRSARPGGGNVDAFAAQCLRRAWRWMALKYPAPGYANQTLHVAWPFTIYMRKRYPDIPSGWEDPENWGMLSGDVATYPSNWSHVAEPLLWQNRHYVRLLKMRAPVSVVLSDPREIIDYFPVLADELYEDVFSALAATKYAKADCSRDSDARVSGQVVQKLTTVLQIKDGRALIDWQEDAMNVRERRLARCLATKLGLRRTIYAVPGETDAAILLKWPVELSPRKESG
jgi:hypothetical protein